MPSSLINGCSDDRDCCCCSLFSINPAKVQDFFRNEDSLKENPANIQEFFTFSAKKGFSAHKSCINAGFFNNANKNGNNDALLHYYWITRLFQLTKVGL